MSQEHDLAPAATDAGQGIVQGLLEKGEGRLQDRVANTKEGDVLGSIFKFAGKSPEMQAAHQRLRDKRDHFVDNRNQHKNNGGSVFKTGTLLALVVVGLGVLWALGEAVSFAKGVANLPKNASNPEWWLKMVMNKVLHGFKGSLYFKAARVAKRLVFWLLDQR